MKRLVYYLFTAIHFKIVPCINLTNGTPGVNKFKKAGKYCFRWQTLEKDCKKRERDIDGNNTQPKVSQYQPYFHHWHEKLGYFFKSYKDRVNSWEMIGIEWSGGCVSERSAGGLPHASACKNMPQIWLSHDREREKKTDLRVEEWAIAERESALRLLMH